MPTRVSKYSGIALLVVGLVLLFIVFFLAYNEYMSIEKPSVAGVESMITWIMEWGAYIVIKVAFLGVMRWVGSIITMRAVTLLTAPSETIPSE